MSKDNQFDLLHGELIVISEQHCTQFFCTSHQPGITRKVLVPMVQEAGQADTASLEEEREAKEEVERLDAGTVASRLLVLPRLCWSQSAVSLETHSMLFV